MGFAEAVRLVIENLQFITGGSRGIPGIPTIKNPLILVSIGIVVFWIMRNYIASRHGRNCVAIREDETAAQSIGVNTTLYKQRSFFINGILAGLSGALLAHYVGFIQPSMFGIAKSTELIIMVIFGGMHSLTGALLSVIILTTLPELLRQFAIWRLVLYGGLVVIIMIVRPEGLLGSRELRWQSFKNFGKWINSFFARKN